jgi:hypothetical protein
MHIVLTPQPDVADVVDLWRVAHGSHAAVSLDRRTAATAVRVLGGSFEIDPSGDTAVLELELGPGTLHGTARRSSSDLLDGAIWTVSGTLTLDTTSVPVVIGLRDHGITHRRGTWRWLSGTGGTPRCGRRRKRTVGAPIVLDLLLQA